jgi:hypothetical protein
MTLMDLGDDSLERCVSPASRKKLREAFARALEGEITPEEMSQSLHRASAEARAAGCRPEELLLLIREAWAHRVRPITLPEREWERLYHHALAECLTAFFGTTPSR